MTDFVVTHWRELTDSESKAMEETLRTAAGVVSLYDKKDLRFEDVKGVNFGDVVTFEKPPRFAKETLGKPTGYVRDLIWGSTLNPICELTTEPLSIK